MRPSSARGGDRAHVVTFSYVRSVVLTSAARGSCGSSLLAELLQLRFSAQQASWRDNARTIFAMYV